METPAKYPMTPFSLLRETLGVTVTNLLPLLAMRVLFLLPMVALVTWEILAGPYSTQFSTPPRSVGVMVLALVFQLFRNLALAGVTWGTISYLWGGRRGVVEQVKVCFRRVHKLLALIFLANLPIGLLNAGLGLTPSVYTALPVEAWMVLDALAIGVVDLLFCLAVPVLVMERAGVFGSLQRSVVLPRGSRVAFFTTLVLMLLLTSLPSHFLMKALETAMDSYDPEEGLGPWRYYRLWKMGLNMVFTLPLLVLPAVAYVRIRTNREEATIEELVKAFR